MIKSCILILVLFFFSIACSKRSTGTDDDNKNDQPLVTKAGLNTAFEMAAWNIEWFPKSGPPTIDYVKSIIRDLDVDLFAVQEIASVHSFNTLLDSLPGWGGVLSNDTYGDGSYQKTGILYKTSFISLSSVKNIFTSDGYAFPRPPLSASVKIKDLDGTKFDFTVIVVHLKAMSGKENEARRRSACENLKEYIDNEITSGADPDFVVIGDWNDILTDPESENVFKVFLDDTTNYNFLTQALNGRYSYISNTYNSLIDHILITGSSKNFYGNGLTDVLYLDDEFIQYRSLVSDHRPVMARFGGFTLNLQPPAENNN